MVLYQTDPTITLMAILIIAVPFISAVILLILNVFEIRKSLTSGNAYKLSENLTGSLGVGSLTISWILSIILAIRYFAKYVTLGDHINIVKIEAAKDYIMIPTTGATFVWNILIDPLSVVFLLLLTTIATTIHLYATGYMHSEPAYTRFFGSMNFFTGSMLGFVLASNLFMAFIFWELLGVSSYLLIGYYWQKSSASAAAKKAFLYNKIGDVSFVLALGLLFQKIGTFDYLTITNLFQTGQLHLSDIALPALLLFGAAVGKSAQFPLFGWLPEAMEGPTPVSSLLHSSTMVKAGLFLVARNFLMYYGVDNSFHVITSNITSAIGHNSFFTPANLIAWIGTMTALLGGLIAITATDIKKVLAFSTISQLGYIALALGAGGLTASFYHLISHATFKSLLFLCAGSVIHAVHSNEYKDMGGLRKKMPWTFWTMTAGLLGLAGFPLMNGFWSKDAVILSIYNSGTDHGGVVIGAFFLYLISVITAGITAFYSTKMWVLTFFGEPKYDEKHVHPGPTEIKMRIALVILGTMVVLESIWFTLGTLFGKESILNFEYTLGAVLGQHGGEFQWSFAIWSIVAGLSGILLALMIYMWHFNLRVPQFIDSIVRNRFGLDMAIYWLAETPAMAVGDAFQVVDKEFIDGWLIDNIATDKIGHGGAKLSDDIDVYVVDGFVRWLERAAKTIGRETRRFQSGKTSLYARMMTIGVVVLLTAFSLVQLGWIHIANL